MCYTESNVPEIGDLTKILPNSWITQCFFFLGIDCTVMEIINENERIYNCTSLEALLSFVCRGRSLC